MKQKKRNIINFQTDVDLDYRIERIKKARGIKATSDLLRSLIYEEANRNESRLDQYLDDAKKEYKRIEAAEAAKNENS